MTHEKTEEELMLLGVESNKPKSRKVKLQGYGSDSSDDESEDDEEIKSELREDRGNREETTGVYPSKVEKEDSSKMAGKIKGALNMNQFEKDLEEEKDAITLPDLEVDEDLMISDNEDNEEEKEYATKEIQDYFNNQENEEIDISNRQKVKKFNGPKLEAFNLDKEKREGVFDENGNYIRREDSESDEEGDDDEEGELINSNSEKKINSHDTWLVGVNKDEIDKAKRAELRRKELIADNEAKEKQMNLQYSIPDLLLKLIPCLQSVETSLEALQRLNQSINKLKKRMKKEKQTQGQVIADEMTVLKSQVTVITDTVKLLESKSKRYGNIYELEKEQLIRDYEQYSGSKYQSSNGNGLKRKRDDQEEESGGYEIETPQHHPVGVQCELEWEYHWDNDDEIHGPYSSETMRSWKEADYFVETLGFARVYGTQEEFRDINEISF